MGRVFCSGCVSASSSVCSSVSASAVGSCEMSMSRPSDPAFGVDGPVMLRQREQGRGPGRGPQATFKLRLLTATIEFGIWRAWNRADSAHAISRCMTPSRLFFDVHSLFLAEVTFVTAWASLAHVVWSIVWSVLGHGLRASRTVRRGKQDAGLSRRGSSDRPWRKQAAGDRLGLVVAWFGGLPWHVQGLLADGP